MIGIISGLSLFYALINLTVQHKPHEYVMSDIDPEETIIIPQTWQKPKVILPPTVEKVEDIEIPTPTMIVTPVKTIQEKLTAEDFKDSSDTKSKAYNVDSMMQSTKAMIPEIVERQEEDEILPVAEQMPRFPGCEDMIGSKVEKQTCAEKNLLSFIYKNLKYPQVDKEYRNQGTVIVRFVVDKEGKVADIKVVRDVGIQCGKEAERVVRLMNEMQEPWTPGKQRGRAVNVQFTLPIKFKLM